MSWSRSAASAFVGSLGSDMEAVYDRRCVGADSRHRPEGALELTDDAWERQVVARAEPILVDFWAPWCVPCRKIAPMVAEVGRRHAGHLAIGELDVDAHPRVAARHDVLSLPTVILFRAGEPVARLVGRITPDRLEAAVAPRLGEGASTDRRTA